MLGRQVGARDRVGLFSIPTCASARERLSKVRRVRPPSDLLASLVAPDGVPAVVQMGGIWLVQCVHLIPFIDRKSLRL